MSLDNVDIVVLDGATPHQEKISRIYFDGEWENCLVPSMLMGYDIVAKPIRSYVGAGVPDFQPAVYMLIEADTGFAPIRWQLGPYCNRGMIGFARKDGKPFFCQQWADLHEYIYGVLMDQYSDAKSTSDVDKIICNMLNPTSFSTFLKNRK